MKKLSILVMLLSACAFGQMSSTGNIITSGSTCGTTNACVPLTLFNSPTLSTTTATIAISGTFSGTIQFEGTSDNVNWTALPGIPLAGGNAASSATTTGTWTFGIGALNGLRARASAFASGTATVLVQAAGGSGATSAAGVAALFGGPGTSGQYLAANGTLQTAGGGGTVTSVSGTTNQIDVATGTTTPVISLDSVFLTAGGDLTGTFPSPTVTKINATSLAGLGTGILKNTTATGVPSIAVAADLPLLPVTNTQPLGGASNYWSNIFSSAVQCGIAGTIGCVITMAGGTSGSATITAPAIAATPSNPYALSNAIQLPSIAAFAPTVAGTFGYDSTNNRYVGGNGTNTSFLTWITGTPTTNTIPKFSGTLGSLASSSITDNGFVTSTEIIRGSNTVFLTADSSAITATTAATAVTVFTLPPLQASKNYALHCSGTTTQATAGGGIGIAITFGTTGPTNAELRAVVLTSPTTQNGQSSGNITTTTATAIYTGVTGTLTTQLPWTIDGSIEVGATPPASIVIGFFSASASDAVTAKRDSSCSVLP